MRTQFIDNETVRDVKEEVDIDIKFTSGDNVTINKIRYNVESIDMDFDRNLMYVWLDALS